MSSSSVYPRTLVSTFRGALSANASDCHNDAELFEQLCCAIAAGTAALPLVRLDPHAFVAHLGSLLPAGADIPDLRTSDLYLALACALGDATAVREFDTRYRSDSQAALAKLGATPHVQDEVWQIVLSEMCVPPTPHQPAKLASYRGRGPLRSWVRSVAVRQGLRKLGRGKSKETLDSDGIARAIASSASPELACMENRYRAEFHHALRIAFAELSDRERTLLGQHYLDGLSVAELGRLYRVHRATAGRWVSSARDSVASRTRELLMHRLSLQRGDVTSIVRLVRSQLDASLRRYLAADLRQ